MHTALLTPFALALGTFAIVILGVPAAVTAFSAWSTSAWRRGRPWAWWLWAIVTGLAVVTGLLQLGGGRSSWSAWSSLVVGPGTLVLLSHPENRGRVDGPVEPLPVNAHPAYYR